MGCAHSKRNPTYSVRINPDDKPEGETHVYRSPSAQEGLTTHFKHDPKVKTIQDLYNMAFEKFADKPFLGMREKKGEKEFGSYKFKTYKEVQEISKQVGSAMVNLDLAPKVDEFKGAELKFVGIWAKNSEQWIEIDIACAMYKFVSIPIYSTLGPEIVKFILDQTNLSSIFCSNDHVDELIEGVSKHGYKSLKNVIAFEDVKDDQKSKAKEAGITLYSLSDLIKKGKEKIQEPVEVKPEDMYTICYTSGTTGTPKGALLSHGSQTSSIAAIHDREDLDIDENDVYFSYLPLAHCMERSGILFMISMGTHIGFSTGDKKKMAEDIKELKPTILFGVPKVFNAMYENIKKEIEKQGPAKSGLAKMAIQLKLLNLKTRGVYTHPIYDRLIFNKIREAMGGRLRYAATGAAPISAEILNFLRVAWCIPIVEGYGPTEGCAITFLNSPNDPKTGQVGGPMGCIEFKLVDQKEMKYTSKDEHPRGEVCFRGPCAFSGYYKQEEKTKEAVDKDGWVHTGDIGQINPDGSLTIVDKMKSFFKLSQGEYVAGDKVEEAYGKSKLVKEMFVYGDSNESFLVAVVVPEQSEVEKLAKELNLGDESFDKLAEKKELRQKILEEMDSAAKEKKLNGFEKVKNIYLEKDSFKKLDLMTPTEKLKRNEAKEKFKKSIDAMYKEGPIVDKK